MRRLFLILAALLFGCDDPNVVANIDNFTCALIPSWMADCTSQEVHDKAVAILSTGIVEAEADCEGQYTRRKGAPNGCGTTELASFKYRAQKLIDGACFVPGGLIARGQPGAPECSSEQSSAGSSPHFALANGLLTVTSSEDSVCYDPQGFQCYPCATPPTVLNIEDVCTGFNLEAFGVE